MKGFATSTTFKVILYTIVFILVAFLLFKYAPGAISEVMAALGIGAPRSDIESAILCSYYRCVEGCYSSKVQQLKWKGHRCFDFCSIDQFLDSENKICGWNSEQYPVEIELTDGEKTIEKNHVEDAFECILPPNPDYGLNPGFPGIPSILFIGVDVGLASYEEESCTARTPIGKVNNALKRLEIGSKFVYITSVKQGIRSAEKRRLIPVMNTTVTTTPKYILSKPNEKKTIEFIDDATLDPYPRHYRIVIKEGEQKIADVAAVVDVIDHTTARLTLYDTTNINNYEEKDFSKGETHILLSNFKFTLNKVKYYIIQYGVTGGHATFDMEYVVSSI